MVGDTPSAVGADEMATYLEIQNWVKSHHGFVPKTCWIAHCKDMCGLDPRRSPNRYGEARTNPCPLDKTSAIIEAFRHFEMM
jgi:hypothetical protein